MAVDLATLRVRLRVGDSADEDTELTALLAHVQALVDVHMQKGSDPYPAAVQPLVDEAVTRACGWAYDTPPGSHGGSGNVMRHSGAARLLRDVRPRAAGVVGAE